MSLGNSLFNARKKSGLSQEEAAEKKNLEYIQKEIEQPAELMEEA